MLSALGVLGLGITQFYSQSARQLVAAAQQAHVKRLIVVTSSGTDPTEHEPRWYLWLLRRLLINFYVDMARMEEIIMAATELEWIIVRPPYLTNGEKTGVYRVMLRHLAKGAFVSHALT